MDIYNIDDFEEKLEIAKPVVRIILKLREHFDYENTDETLPDIEDMLMDLIPLDELAAIQGHDYTLWKQLCSDGNYEKWGDYVKRVSTPPQ